MKTSVTFSNLLPGKVYKFEIFVSNDVGRCEQSRYITVAIKPGAIFIADIHFQDKNRFKYYVSKIVCKRYDLV